MFGTETDEERAEYVAAFEVIMQMMQRLHGEGVLLLPGTDLGGSFAYHRELELFEQIEPIFRELGGRPHWGKHYNLTRQQLQEMYGDNYDRFVEIDHHDAFDRFPTQDLSQGRALATAQNCHLSRRAVLSNWLTPE